MHDRGRLVSSRPEVEWDEQEQGWMLALASYEENRCPGCGGDIDVTTDAKNEDGYRHQLPLQCFRCVAFSQAHQEYAEQPHPLSLIHLVPARPSARPARS